MKEFASSTPQQSHMVMVPLFYGASDAITISWNNEHCLHPTNTGGLSGLLLVNAYY